MSKVDWACGKHEPWKLMRHQYWTKCPECQRDELREDVSRLSAENADAQAKEAYALGKLEETLKIESELRIENERLEALVHRLRTHHRRREPNSRREDIRYLERGAVPPVASARQRPHEATDRIGLQVTGDTSRRILRRSGEAAPPPIEGHWGRYWIWRPTTTCHSEERKRRGIQIALPRRGCFAGSGDAETPRRGVSTQTRLA